MADSIGIHEAVGALNALLNISEKVIGWAQRGDHEYARLAQLVTQVKLLCTVIRFEIAAGVACKTRGKYRGRANIVFSRFTGLEVYLSKFAAVLPDAKKGLSRLTNDLPVMCDHLEKEYQHIITAYEQFMIEEAPADTTAHAPAYVPASAEPVSVEPAATSSQPPKKATGHSAPSLTGNDVLRAHISRASTDLEAISGEKSHPNPSTTEVLVALTDRAKADLNHLTDQE